MPNKWSFKMKPVKELLERIVGNGEGWIDPFAGFNSPAEITNDANVEAPTTHHMDALEFLKKQETGSAEGALYDPPYTIEMAKRRYNYNGYTDTASFTRYMSQCKREIARIVKVGGCVVSLGWSSNGIGMKYGFYIEEILLLAHGSYHYDTIITIENKLCEQKILNWLADKKE
jgi:hypothetical protein